MRRIAIMGIVNVTPDSFSDGGRFIDPSEAVDGALKMIREGASIIDLGAESTRPGSKPVSAPIQLSRLLPVLKAFRKKSNATVSIDTQSAAVAEACLGEGANIINDVSALRRDRRLLDVVAKARCEVVLMHMQGTPRTMQRNPRYENVTREVFDFLAERIAVCEKAGIARKKIIVDPGFGFGKAYEHNLQLFHELKAFRALRCRLLVGVSRKSFIGKLIGEENPTKRATASALAGLTAVEQGASILRVHDVADQRRALEIWRNLREGVKTRLKVPKRSVNVPPR
jgi:dihydropteroate synthase